MAVKKKPPVVPPQLSMTDIERINKADPVGCLISIMNGTSQITDVDLRKDVINVAKYLLGKTLANAVPERDTGPTQNFSFTVVDPLAGKSMDDIVAKLKSAEEQRKNKS